MLQKTAYLECQGDVTPYDVTKPLWDYTVYFISKKNLLSGNLIKDGAHARVFFCVTIA